MKIQLEDYNPSWSHSFHNEKQFLLKILSPTIVNIEHVGSTSVEGLKAKPIIDIMIGLDNFDIANGLIEKMTNAGYEYVSKFEDVMPFRRYFTKQVNDEKTHHIHMVTEGSDFWNRMIRFRDILRTNDKVRIDYFELKRSLAEREWEKGSDYAEAKSEFILSVLGS